MAGNERLWFRVEIPDYCRRLGSDDTRREFLCCLGVELVAGVYIETPGIEAPVDEERWNTLMNLAARHGLALQGDRRYEWWVSCDATVYSDCVERILGFLREARKILGDECCG